MNNLLSLILIFFILACGGGESSTNIENGIDVYAPTPPTELILETTSANQASVTWTASQDESSEVVYNVFLNDVFYEETTDTLIVLNNLEAETTYSTFVSAIDSAGNISTPSETLVFRTTRLDEEPPKAPIDLDLISRSESSISISWSPSTDNFEVLGYIVYRNGLAIANVEDTSYEDSNLTANTLYTYTVQAYDISNNFSELSSSLEVRTNEQSQLSTVCTGEGGETTPVPFEYFTVKNTGKYITLSAISNETTYNTHSYLDSPNIDWSKRYKKYRFGNGGGVVTSWGVESLPANGRLYEAGEEVSIETPILDPDRLFYSPNLGFVGEDSFSYCAVDHRGISSVARVTIKVEDSSNYTYPLGIPNPNFGIVDSPPPNPVSWDSEETEGFYYIDSDAVNCSDDYEFGFRNIPRCTIPALGASVGPNAKMVLAQSELPYLLRDSGWQQIDFRGEENRLSWIIGEEHGPHKPVISLNPLRNRSGTELRITGSYIRISGITFDGPSLEHQGGGANNVVVRHSEFKNNPSIANGGTVIGLATGGKDVLVFNVYAHDNGIVDEEMLSRERDIHAFVGVDQENFWLLDIRCDENAGDCVQLTNHNTTKNVYVGRMIAHSEGENCIDIKDFNKVVVSESDCWDLRLIQYGNSGGNAQSFYVNDEGVQKEYAFFINNRSWDTGGANYAASNIGGEVYFIGNVSFHSPAAYGLFLGGGAGGRFAYLNSFIDSDIGLYHFGSGTSNDRFIIGNAVSKTKSFMARLQSSTQVVDMWDYNYYESFGRFGSGGSTPMIYENKDEFTHTLGFDENGGEGQDFEFKSESELNFGITENSILAEKIPVDIMRSLPGLSEFELEFGGALKDKNGSLILENDYVDIGAFQVGRKNN